MKRKTTGNGEGRVTVWAGGKGGLPGKELLRWVSAEEMREHARPRAHKKKVLSVLRWCCGWMLLLNCRENAVGSGKNEPSEAKSWRPLSLPTEPLKRSPQTLKGKRGSFKEFKQSSVSESHIGRPCTQITGKEDSAGDC
jgi:hypothetical protein